MFYIPTSGLSGENLATRSSVSQLTSWYSGPSLLEQIGKTSVTALNKCYGYKHSLRKGLFKLLFGVMF